MTRWLNDDIALIDLKFQGLSHVIASYVLRTDDGLAIIECGPTTTIDELLGGLSQLGLNGSDIRHVLVTHIHLDHAGAAGILLRRYPDARYYVHEVGAPHSIEPANLIRSASRIYGDQMDMLWGEIVPVPEDRVRAINDGDVLEIGDRTLRVLYTPGHASHHVAYYDERHNIVFTGDVAGVRIPPSDRTLPPTPPPDIDVEAWHRSIERLRELQPDSLLLTHFGPVDAVGQHLDELRTNLDGMIALLREMVAAGLDRDAMVSRIAEYIRFTIGNDMPGEVEERFALNVPYGMAVDGLLRYLKKRGDVSSS